MNNILTRFTIVGIMIALLAILSTPAGAQAGSTGALFSGLFERSAASVSAGERTRFPIMNDVEAAYEIWVVATAYSSDPNQTDDTPCIPAMSDFDLCSYYEQYGRADTIAANFLSLGRQVEFIGTEDIPHMEEVRFTVRDRMNAKYNGTNRIDVWMPSLAQAKEFGVRRIKMKVYPYR